MIRLAVISFVLATAAAAFASPPYCATGTCYQKPVTYAVPAAPNYTYNTTNTYHPPNVYFVGVPVPVDYAKPIALQGRTPYSYSLKEAYGDPFDLNLAFDKAVRLGELAGETHRQASENTLAIIKTQQDARNSGARVAAITEAVVSAIEADNAAPKDEAEIVLQTKRPVKVSKKVASRLKTPNAVLKARCVSCHSDKYADWDSLDYDTQFSIFSHVTDANPQVRMPKANGGKDPGKPLPPAEILLLTPISE